MQLGPWEWALIALIALLLFGGTRLAGIGKNAGKAIREFKEETSDLKSGKSSEPDSESSDPESGSKS